jgi:hypothetical protein
MSSKYPVNLLRIEGAWVERVKSLGRIHGQIVAATERTLQRLFNSEGSLVPIPIRTDVGRRRLDERRSRD